MRRNVGLTLAAATLLVSSRFSAGPGAQAPPAEQVVGRVPIPGTPVKDADQSKNKLQGKCTAYDRKLGARNFPSDDTQSAAYKVITKFVDESKYADPAQYDHLKFVIALVPDPKHTNLSLFFDRQMAAIQAAAQDEGYSYDSSWMPWKLSNRAYPLLADDQFRAESDEDRESCPGIITFWQDPVDLKAGSSGQTRYENGLMVLVVGEQPTGGLNQDQWTNAVNWISGRMSETREDRILRVLGPTFSGSLIPFEHALEKLEHSPGKPRTFNQIQVLSGTISSCRLLTWFQHQSPANVVLGSFQENDALQLYRFLDFIHKRGWQTEDVAIISEDETSYARNVADMGSLGSCGSSFWTTDKQPVSLSYPRDISALRVEYQKQAVGINNTERSTHLVLNENAEVPDLNTEADDTIGAYAGPMTPLNQEAILYGIVGYLRTHHTRYIILRCTNPLDFLFLARFFHRAYPLGRIVTEGSELLFVRELETNDFRGLMALSTYPLRPSGEWLPLNPQGPHVHRVFEAHTVEGEYLAGRYSFGSYKISRTTGQHGSSLLLQVTNPLPDIEPPNWVGIAQSSTRLHAPTWVSVLAREGYWPVSVLNSEEPEEGKTPTSTLVHYKLDTAARPEVYKTPWIPISWQVCQGLAMALFAYELFGLAAGSKFSSLALLAPFRRSRSSSHLFLLGENAGLASALLLLFLLLDFGSQATQLSSPALFCLSWRLWLGIFVGGLLLGLFSRWSSNWILPFVCGFICALAATLGASFGALQVEACAKADPVCGSVHYALYYRMFHLTSGISPVLPILLLSLGLYLWNWLALTGNSLLLFGRPILPSCLAEGGVPKDLLRLGLESGRAAQVKLMASRFRISAAMEWRILGMANPLSIKWQIVALPCLLGGGTVLFFSDNLTALQRLRLRRTFSRLRAIDATTLWSVSGDVSRIQYRFFTKQMDAARRLVALSRNPPPFVTKAIKCADQFASASAPNVNGGPNWNQPLRVDGEQCMIREVLADAAAEVLNGLEEEWRSETDSLDLETDEPQPANGEASNATLPLSESPEVRACEEFICFHYIAFIQNILGRMRTMTLSMVSVFLLSCFSISFYPFVPRTQVSIWMISNLVLIGAGVIYVYAKMERDEILSYITDTSPGHLTFEFWLRTAGFLIGPVIGILTTQFPQIADAFLGFLQPGLEAIKGAQ